ncbi:MAG: prepilin-type N-terminal cleavage/methylation domain-containing protein [Deltaproteobacteria bacterium]|nr:prepilin-type N-terminal cleavage/methylation domain-containing protein [Deltaproteobacteria bacterium]
MKKRKQDTTGYTLIELTVVIFLIGILFSITLPRIHDTSLTDHFKTATRRMISLINQLKNDAVRTNTDYLLYFNLESGKYWIEYDDMTDADRIAAREKADSLPEDVRIVDIWFKGTGKEMMGETSIFFSRKGYIQPAVIHLRSEDEREFTLVLKPFLGKVEILDHYVEFEDI